MTMAIAVVVCLAATIARPNPTRYNGIRKRGEPLAAFPRNRAEAS